MDWNNLIQKNMIQIINGNCLVEMQNIANKSIEMDNKYFEIAVKRINEAKQKTLFE